MAVRLSTTICVAILLAAAGVAGAAPSAPAAPRGLTVTLDGVGGVTAGLRRAEVERRWDVALELTPRGSECQSGRVGLGAARGLVLFDRGRVGAVWFSRGVVTGRGVRIGSTTARLQAAYGTLLRSEPNKYSPGAVDLYVTRARRPVRLLRFDVSPWGRVTRIGYGGPLVRLVEGCS